MKSYITRTLCSVVAVAVLLAGILGPFPGSMAIFAATEITDEDRLGDWLHYNGLIFGNMTSYTADAEGALAVGGDYAHFGIGGGYDVGGSYSFAPTAQLGQYTNPEKYPTLLLGVKDIKVRSLDNSSSGGHFNVFGGPIVMSPETTAIHNSQNTKLVASTGASWATASQSLIDSWFNKQYKLVTSASRQYLGGNSSSVSLADFSSGAYISAGPQAYLNETLKYEGQVDKKVLVVNVQTGTSVNFSGSTYLPVPGEWATKYELVIYNFPDAVNVTMSGDPQRLVTSLGSYNKTYPSYYLSDAQAKERDSICTNVLYNFPDAQSITMTTVFFMGSILAPDALLSANGGSINGQLTCRDFVTQGSCELHALRLTRRAYNLTEEPEETANVEIEKYLYYKAPTSVTLRGAEFQLFRYDEEKGLYTSYSNELYTVGADGKCTITGLPLDKYLLVEVTPPYGISLNTDDPSNKYTYHKFEFELDSAGETLTIARYNEPVYTDLCFKKVDSADGRALEGAQFQIIRLPDANDLNSEQTSATVTSGADGTFRFRNVAVGSYVLKELAAPAGYERMEDIAFEVYAGGKGALEIRLASGGIIDASEKEPYPVENSRGQADNRIFIFKYDSAGSLSAGTATGLEGAEFSLYRKDGDAWTLVKESSGNTVDIVTSATGYYQIDNLPPGTYRLVEVDAPDGYRITESIPDSSGYFPDGYAAEFTVEDTDPEVFVNIANTALTTGLRLVKRSGVSGETALLSGASFELQDSEGKTISTGTSNSQGAINFSGLTSGTYRLVETAAPQGFLPLEEPVIVTISFDDNDEAVVQVDYQGKTGAAQWDGTNNSVAVYQDACTGGLLLYKMDQDMFQNGVDWAVDKTFTINYLEGAVFQLERKLNGFSGAYTAFGSSFTSAYTGATDAYGNKLAAATVDGLPYGDYRIVEVQAPDGYTINAVDGIVGYFSITKAMAEAGHTVELEATNAKDTPRGNISIKKADADSPSTALSGVEFKLWSIDDPQGILNGRQHLEEVMPYVMSFGQNKYATSVPLVTGDDGTLTISLEPGLYILFEYGPPDGYLYTLERGQSLERATDPAFYDYTYLFRVVAVDEIDKDAGVRIKWVDRYKILDGEVIGFDIDSHDVDDWNQALFKPEEYLSFTITNKKENLLANVQFLKTAAVDGEAAPTPLKGASFQLRRADIKEGDDPDYTESDYSTIVGTYTSGEGGIVLMEDLPAGMYQLTETTAPQGYVLLEEPVYFSLQINGYSKMLDLYNGEGSLVMAGYDEPTVNADGSVTGSPAFHKLLDLDPVENKQEPTGEITLRKEDSESCEAIPGAVFSLYVESGTAGDPWALLLSGLTTGQDGTLTIPDLDPGSYKLVETSPPPGYRDDQIEAFFTLTLEEDKIVVSSPDGWDGSTLTIANEKLEEETPSGEITLRKEDSESGEALPGAVFSLYVETGTAEDPWSLLLSNLTTGQDGTLTIPGLEPGNYKLVETSPPPGYRDDQIEAFFTLTLEEDKIVVSSPDGWDGSTLTIANEKLEEETPSGEITLRKEDSESGEALPGAVFSLYVESGTAGDPWALLLYGLTTGQDGTLTIPGLEPGSYKLVETSPPPGYRDDKVEVYFTLEKDGDSISAHWNQGVWGDGGVLHIENQKETEPEKPGEPTGSIEFIKVDAESGNPLSGAVFDLYRHGESTPLRTGLQSGEDGLLLLENLAPGAYRLVETKAPAGYEAGGNSIEFEMVLEGDRVIPESRLNSSLEGIRYTLYQWIDGEDPADTLPEEEATTEEDSPAEDVSGPEEEGSDEVSDGADDEGSEDGASSQEDQEGSSSGEESSADEEASGDDNDESQEEEASGEEPNEGEVTSPDESPDPAGPAAGEGLSDGGDAPEDDNQAENTAGAGPGFNQIRFDSLPYYSFIELPKVAGGWQPVPDGAYSTSAEGIITLDGLPPGRYRLVPEDDSLSLTAINLEWEAEETSREIQAVSEGDLAEDGPLEVKNRRIPDKETSQPEEPDDTGSGGGKRGGSDRPDTDRPHSSQPEKTPQEAPQESGSHSSVDDNSANPETGHAALTLAVPALLLAAVGFVLYKRRRLD